MVMPRTPATPLPGIVPGAPIPPHHRKINAGGAISVSGAPEADSLLFAQVVRDGDPCVSGFAFGSGNLVLGDTRGVGTIDGAHGARDHDKPIIAR